LIAKRDKRTQMGAFVVSGSHGRRGEAQTRTNTPYGVFVVSVDRERVVFVRGWLQRKARHHESAQTGAFVVSGLSVCVEKRWGGSDPPRCLPRHVSKKNKKKGKKGKKGGAPMRPLPLFSGLDVLVKGGVGDGSGDGGGE